MPRMERLYRYQQNGAARFAVASGDAAFELDGDIFGARSKGREIGGGLGSLKLLPPVTPTKIVCVGLNYKDHAAEQNKPLPAEPLLFIKPSTAVIGAGDAIRLPPGVGRVDHEAELGVVIGRRAHRVKRANAWDHVLGLICVNDVTARDLQNRESQVHALQGLRHVRADRPVHRGGPRRPSAGGRGPGERSDTPVVQHVTFDLPDRSSRGVHHVRHDARTRRYHLDGHAGRHRAARARRFGDGQGRRGRRPDESGQKRIRGRI